MTLPTLSHDHRTRARVLSRSTRAHVGSGVVLGPVLGGVYLYRLMAGWWWGGYINLVIGAICLFLVPDEDIHRDMGVWERVRGVDVL